MARGKTGARGGRTGNGRRIGLAILLLLILVPAGQMAWSTWGLQRPYKGYEESEKLVTIPPGTAAGQVLDKLERAGVIVNGKLARIYLVFKGNPKLQAGQYLFKGAKTTPQVLGMLVRGQTVSRFVTIVEGLTLEEIADQLARAKFGRREVFLDLMRSPKLIADLDPDAPDLEGYLFPETYNFASGTREREIVETLVKTFRRRFERDVRPLIAQGPPGRTVRRIVTLASIVEKEAKASSDRPLIAAVYRNRLDRRIGLAADPTVIYALKRVGRWNGNIRKEDLRMDSPYNTYRYAGLPPGPICSPGLASLAAAAAPADVPYLYFVSRNDGTHVFAQTLAEHNRNVEIWQRKYWRDRWAAERRERQAGR
ncbi:MAG TPA: endolytic transglycosylase MltG [Thermoanaerobaculia bacterium]